MKISNATVGFFLFIWVIALILTAITAFTGCTRSSGMELNEKDLTEGVAKPFLPGPQAKISWEKENAARKAWSQYVFNEIETKYLLQLSAAKDVTRLCPRYGQLYKDYQITVWVELISAMAKFESQWKPTMFFRETGLGRDLVTGQTNTSQGLMQVSYQDTLKDFYSCNFDWSKDRYLADNNPKKTIFDPYKNLDCGLKILAKQVRVKGRVVLKKANRYYWSVLEEDREKSKVPAILAMTSSLPFCR